MSQPVETGACPICGKPRDPRLRPFCSKRCADLDLARWLKGEYSIPGAPEGEEGPGPGSDEPPEIH
jgi:endogenous inhibitor of DNA gyrase (YacG/DUF329 family)